MLIQAEDRKALKNALGQKPPAIVVFSDGSNDKPLHDALKREAKKRGDDMLAVHIDAAANPDALAQYGDLSLPALVTLTKSFFGRKVVATAENVRPADVRAHVAHLIDDKPLPEDKPQREARTEKGKATHVTDKTFRRAVLKSKTPVLVDFWAEWCAPCRSIAPVIESMADEYRGRVKVVKLNTEQNGATARQYDIQSIPTFILFENGQPVERRSGASPAILRDMVEEAILRSE